MCAEPRLDALAAEVLELGLHEAALGVRLLGARDRERCGARVRERRAVHLVLALLALEERVVVAERLVDRAPAVAQQLLHRSAVCAQLRECVVMMR